MKKLFNSIDKKFFVSLLIIVTLLSTFTTYQIYATITAEKESQGNPSHSAGEDGRYISYADLINEYDILCCYHGGDDAHLPSANNVILEAGGSATATTDSGKTIGYLVKGDEGETALTTFKQEIDENSPYTEASYSSESYGFYQVASTEIARPKEAYILAEMIEETNGGAVFEDAYSAIQYAWWTTEAGSHGNIIPPDNSLALEGTAFEAYIGKLGSTDPNTFVEQHYDFEIDGVKYEGDVPAPVLTYEPTWNEDANLDGDVNQYDEVTVSWDGNADKQTYTVGPFSIDYVEESYAAEDRPEVVFAGIIDAKLYTNLGEVSKDKWRFNFIKDERDVNDTFEFPHANEVFYIELDYIEGATEITNLHFDFKYMNAGGKYDSLEGTYFEQTWTPDSKVVETCSGTCGHSSHPEDDPETEVDESIDCDGSCSHGYNSSHPTKWQYWLELTGMESKRSQLLAYGIIGARWYEYAELDINGGPLQKEVSIQIIKQIVDENGNVLENVDASKEFTFEIYKNEELYNTVQVSVNKPYTSEKFTWGEEEQAPTFRVVEVLNDDEYEQYGDIQVSGSVEEGLITFTAQNMTKKKEGRVSITKEQLGTGLEGTEFEFKLYIDNEVYVNEPKTSADGTIKVAVGQTWTSDAITWVGDAPSYKVNEINLPENTKLVSIENDTGVLIDDSTVNVTAVNAKEDEEWEKGALTVKKILEGNASSDLSFHIVVKVGDKVYDKYLKAGQSWTEIFTWKKGEKPPQYEVTEIDIPEGCTLVEIKNASGTLTNDSKGIEVVCINDIAEESGRISIHKETKSDDKEGVDENNDVFTFVTRISGTFEMSGESVVNGTREITSTLKSGETVTLDEITWKGDSPTYEVTETELPDGWKMESITNSSGTLQANETIQVNCVNIYKITIEYDLTMEMSGIVWEDAPLNEEDKNTEDSKPNGKYDTSEFGIEKVEVVIKKKVYDANGNVIDKFTSNAIGYEDGNNVEIEFPLYTNTDGYWEAPRMSVPFLTEEEKAEGGIKADYDVEFTYDGQTYKPTDFLVSGTVEEFRKASNADKSKFLTDSMAYETEQERNYFDSKFEVITGNTPIDENGVTNGYAQGNGTQTDLLYYATDSLSTLGNEATRKESELQTTDEGYVREQYKMTSRTSTGGLTYPFDNKVHLESMKKIIDKINGGLIIRYEYSATYPYLLNVNLGLVKRDDAELAVTKDVYEANVVVNQKLLNYKYNEYVDFENEEYQDYLDLQVKLDDANISYKLDLYESDYYYRAKVYESNSVINGALQEFYRSIGKDNLSEELDLDVFLTYKISIYNDSDSYLAQVKALRDYFDEDLILVEHSEERYIQEANGVAVEASQVVAKPAYVIKKGPTDTSAWGVQLEKSIEGKAKVTGATYTNNVVTEGTDNIREESTKVYNEAHINLEDSDFILAVGEKLEVYLTFKVKTDEAPKQFNSTSEAVESYVRLGTKANIAEIDSYSTYYTDGKIAGKVDKDSAPRNADIENKNEKTWYEDDTDSAPIITLDLYTESRDVSGFAWEDEETETIDYSQKVGNGIYDDGERKIGNLTTQMVEKVRVKQSDGTYREYDFVWPTSTVYDFLDNKSLEEITGYDSITLTSNDPANTGDYKFENVPAGNYVVRFVYGYFPADSMEDNGNLIKLDGVSEPKTSDDDSRKPAVYNGQDFKTTIYQVDNVGDDGKSVYSSNGYIDNEWYDFTSCKYEDDGTISVHNSDAIDNEARRLEVIAYSKVINNENAKVLATANDYAADHTELYNKTAMFADTAKINLNIENISKLAKQKIIVTNEVSGQTEEVSVGEQIIENGITKNSIYGNSTVSGDKGTESAYSNYKYLVEAIDIGIEERSNTELVLDKQIETIELKANTGDTILKAVYDIKYEYNLNADTGKAEYSAKVELNKDASFGTENLIAQNKDEAAGLQNFRYIYYQDTISQGLNLKVVYKFTALNVGEVDRTGRVAEMSAEEMLAKATELKAQVYRKDGNNLVNVNHPNVGEYVGSVYYLGKRDAYTQNDTIVSTKVRQLIDYVDNDAVFKVAENSTKNSSWRNITAQELLDGKVINDSIIGEYDGVKNIADDKGVLYNTAEKNNLVLSVDNVDGDTLSNADFIVDIVPFGASKENADATASSCMASMNLVMTRTIDTEIDDSDLSYDNIAEIVKLENTVGKRDIETIPGNADPKLGEFTASLEERDASATELITFTPPTGLGTETSLTIEILMVTLVALAIVLVGVIIIKKTVLKK